jgi:gamma-glutamyltranspeptidase
VIEALQILANYGPRPRATVARDAEYWHYLIESWKARDRIARIADPGQWAVDFEEHLLPAHASELFGRIRRDSAARFSKTPKRSPADLSALAAARADSSSRMPRAT